MHVVVKLFGILRLRYCPNGGDETTRIILDNGSTVKDLVKKLNIESYNEIGFIAVNGKIISSYDVRLEHKDEVLMYSPVFGG